MDESNNKSGFGIRKRHYFKDNEDIDGEPSSKVVVEEIPFGLESFCDEILLEIFKNLDGNSLIAVGKTCVRFYMLITDHRLWKHIDLTSEPLNLQNIRQRLKMMHSQTESIRLRGLTESYPLGSWKNLTLSDSLLRNITQICENLQVLEFHHSFIDLEKISIIDFPNSIKKLVFNTCYVRMPETQGVFFARIDTHFQYLEELYLEFCNWFETHDLVLFSKMPALRKLSLRGCDNLKDCVPYGSIAGRFGFKKLEYLDVRETPISDSDIQCFAFTESLRQLLLECPLELRDSSEQTSSNNHGQFEDRRKRPTFEEAQELSPEQQQQQEQERQLQQQQQQQQEESGGSSSSSYGTCSSNSSGGGNGSSSSSSGGNTSTDNSNSSQRTRRSSEWVILAPNNPRLGNRRPEDNLIHVVVNDYSYINIQPTNRFNNSRNVSNPAIQVNVGNSGGEAVQQGRGRYFNQAMSRSLWFERRYPLPFSPPPIYPISDRGICGFGSPRHPVQPGIVWIRADHRQNDHFLEKLVVRYYKQVTDTSLCHLALCSPNLVYLDLTGTSVTKEGIEKFQRDVPGCLVIAKHLT